MSVIIDREIFKNKILSLCSEGKTFSSACKLAGIHPSSGVNWGKKDKEWKDKCMAVIQLAKADRLENLLEKLAEGHDAIEETSTWIEEDAEGTKVQKTRKVKRLPPNDKAIGMLAKKYAKEFTNTDININHQIGITIKDRALTMTERLNLLKADREEGQVIDNIEFTALD